MNMCSYHMFARGSCQERYV